MTNTQSNNDEPVAAFMESLGFEWLKEDQQWYRTLAYSIGEFQGKARGQYVHPELATFFYELIQSRERAAEGRGMEKAKARVLRRTEIPKDAKNPTRDHVVILGENIADIIQGDIEQLTNPQAGEGSEG